MYRIDVIDKITGSLIETERTSEQDELAALRESLELEYTEEAGYQVISTETKKGLDSDEQ